jgi:hypothetical protein
VAIFGADALRCLGSNARKSTDPVQSDCEILYETSRVPSRAHYDMLMNVVKWQGTDENAGPRERATRHLRLKVYRPFCDQTPCREWISRQLSARKRRNAGVIQW